MGDTHQSPTGGVLIPLAQAVITGSLIGLIAGFGFDLRVGVLVGASGALLTWLHLIRRWLRLLEFSAGLEDQVSSFPEEIPQPEMVRVLLTTETGDRGVYADIPASKEQLVRLGEGLVSGLSFAEGSWTGTGRPFSRSQFRQIRDEFIRRGLARWRDPTARAQGIELTAGGRAAARVFAGETVSPTLSERTNGAHSSGSQI